MKRILLLLITNLYILTVCAQFAASGTYIEQSPAQGTALDNIYIFKSLTGATISYTTESSKTVSISMYVNSQHDAKPVPEEYISTSTLGSKTTYTISDLQDSRGYLINDGQTRGVYVIDYSQHQPLLSSLEIREDESYKCETLDLYIAKTDALNYYGITQGPLRTIAREYQLEYDALEWNNESEKFDKVQKVDMLKNLGTDIQLSAPLVDTKISVSGDQFGRQFGLLSSVSTSVYTAIANQPHIVAEQENRENENELSDNSGQLGGSAPVTIRFYGYSNEPVTRFYTWTIFNKKDLNNPIIRYTDRDIKYEFTEWGEYKVVLETADQSATCYNRDSIDVNVSESYLDVPNFFTPGDSPGSNDEFKVAYKSLVSFKCTIFNRWGSKLYEFRDPSKGWDGRYNGKYVTPGVYFYAIEARGSDGIVYKRKGDINILRSK